MRPPEPVHISSRPVILALCLPVLTAIVLMAPRILDAHFGLFDDPSSISVAQQTWAGDWDWRADAGYGRFRPVYWLAFSLMYAWAGTQAAWYFIGNLLLLAGTGLLLSLIVLRLTHRHLAAGAAGIAFVLGGPVIEAAYTLSKPELLQCFFLTCFAAALVLTSRSPSKGARVRRVLLASLFVLLAALTKETTGVMLAIALSWLAIAWIYDAVNPAGDGARHSSDLREFVLASVLGIGVFTLGVFLLSPSTVSAAGPQANFTFTWDTIQGNANIWLDLIVRDWLYLLPLLAAAVYQIVSARGFVHVPMMLGSLVWMAAWFALYLPYRFSPEYYLLPFSLGAAVLAGVLAMQVVDGARAASPAGSILATACAALAAVLFLLTLPNNLSNAGIQLSVDKANAAMLEFVAENAPADGLVLVNIRADVEYLWQLGPMLHTVHNRPDLAVEPYPDSVVPSEVGGRPTVVVSPIIENVPLPSVRLGIPEEASRGWEVNLRQELEGRLDFLREVRYGLTFLMVDAPRLVCLAAPRIRYCQRPHAPFDTRRFAAGWRIYALRDSGG